MDQFRDVEHQAAGHAGQLLNLDGSLFVKLTTQQEIDFYNTVGNLKEKDPGDEPLGAKFFDWVPTNYGTLESGISLSMEATGEVTDELKSQLKGQEVGKKYLILENLLLGFKKPSVMDIKLGATLYDESLDPLKRERMIKVSKSSTSGSLHFRICGMKIRPKDMEWCSDEKWVDGGLNSSESESDQSKTKSDGYVSIGKFYGRQLTKSNVNEGLELFFENNSLPRDIQLQILEIFHLRLQMFYNSLLDSKLKVVSGSLLFVFENDVESWLDDTVNHEVIYQDEISEDDNDEEETQTKLSSLHFIDFAHARFVDKTDMDIVEGVENLISLVESELDKFEQ